MHLHIGLIMILTTFAAVLIAGFFWRMAQLYLTSRGYTSIGEAMAFVY